MNVTQKDKRKPLTDRQKISVAKDYMSGRKTVTQLMRQVYGKDNAAHIYAIIAHGAKLYHQGRHGSEG